MKWLHPMRVRCYAFAESFNPGMTAVRLAADAISPSRHPLAQNHPWMTRERNAIVRTTDAIGSWRELRDAAHEHTFRMLYGCRPAPEPSVGTDESRATRGLEDVIGRKYSWPQPVRYRRGMDSQLFVTDKPSGEQVPAAMLVSSELLRHRDDAMNALYTPPGPIARVAILILLFVALVAGTVLAVVTCALVSVSLAVRSVFRRTRSVDGGDQPVLKTTTRAIDGSYVVVEGTVPASMDHDLPPGAETRNEFVGTFADRVGDV